MKNYNSMLSVIVPVYNVDQYLRECLLSIVHQSYDCLEIIVVDDGSTDTSFQIAKEIASLYPCIHVYTKSNGGLSDARNFGLNKAKGDYITFIDSDDVLLGTDVYSKVMDCFAGDKQIDVVQYDVIHKWNSSEEHKRSYPFKIYTTKEEIAEGYLMGNIHVSCCDKIFKRKVFEGVRFPLKQQSEDVAVIPLLIARMNKLQTSSIGYYGYRYRENSISTSKLDVAKIIGILTSYYSYFSYTCQLKDLMPFSMLHYTNLVWGYCAVMRKYKAEDILVFVNSSIFFRIKLWEWIKISVKLDRRILLKSFLLCILGPKYAIRFQNIFTH